MDIVSMFSLRPDWVIRLLLATFTGAAIGLERQTRSKEAGTGTHAIVCIAAAAITLVSKYGFEDTAKYDAARIAAQIISGISFLGAGIIFVRNDSIQGLTTAAGVFTTAGIGICYGAGLCGVGLFTGLMVIVIQYLLHHVRHQRGRLLFETRISVATKDSESEIAGIIDTFRKYNRNPGRVSVSEKDNRKVVEMEYVTSHEGKLNNLIKDLKDLPSVGEVTLRRK